MYKLIAIAGTFDRLHKGHRFFISEAFKLGEKVIIGLTSDKYVVEKSKIKNQKSKIHIKYQKYQDRDEELKKFLDREKLLERAEIAKIDDVYGPAIHRGNLQALVVTAETLEGANKVNKKRKELGLKPLEVFKVNLILTEDQERIASTRIRLGEIDRWGRVLINQISNIKYQISNELRNQLKKPLGELVRGNPDDLFEVAEKLKKTVEKTNSVMISTVGDEVTKLCNEVGITINLSIFDYRVGRKEKYHSLKDLGFKWAFARGPLENSLVTVKNPAGNITNELVEAVKNAYSGIISDGKQLVIQVDGEEDLAGVPAILLAPLGTLVLYGQPHEGVVLVEVTEEKKQELMDLIHNS